jgi:hypothetical protein
MENKKFIELLSPLAEWAIGSDQILDGRASKNKTREQTSKPEKGYLVVTKWLYTPPANPVCGHPHDEIYVYDNGWNKWCHKCGKTRWEKLNNCATTIPSKSDV